MSAPQTRIVDQLTGEVAPEGLMNFPALLPDAAEIAQLREDLADARKEIDNLTSLLKDSGNHVANLSTGIAQYQVMRDEYREQAEEYRDQFDHACDERDEARVRVQELTAELETVKRDAAWETGVTL